MSRRTTYRCWMALVFTLSMLPGLLSAAKYKDSDFALLPRYCKVRIHELNTPKADKWHRMFGQPWVDVHHYCNAQHYLIQGRFQIKGSERRHWLLTESIKEFDYILERWPANYKLAPEVHYKRGQALIEFGRYADGLEAFQRSIKLKPNYTPPYQSMAAFYLESGDNAEAERWLRQGLKKNQKSKKLKKALKKLDSKSKSK